MPSRGKRVIDFIETYCRIPGGEYAGLPMKLEPFESRFIRDTYDNPAGTRRAYLSVARKNGKTTLIAAISLAHVAGPEVMLNGQVVSGAMSREQAALVFDAMAKMVEMSPEMRDLVRVQPSQKRIVGLARNVEYRALAADGTTAHGLSPQVAILDEVGQVRGPTSPFVEAIVTSQGAYAKPLLLAISTQAPSDADMFSTWLDDALRGTDPTTIAHLYAAPAGCDLMDRKAWKAANPSLGKFRSIEDLRSQLERAVRIPSEENSKRNLLLNQRIALEQLAIAPSTWKACAAAPDLAALRRGRPVIGLDLSSRNDLTAAVVAGSDDDGIVHVLPFVFCPSEGIEARARRDRAPYDAWVRDGLMIPVAGPSMDFDQIAASLRTELERLDLEPVSVQYDRHMIRHFQAACAREGALQGAEWVEVNQAFKDMGVRLASLQTLLLQKRVRHGSHPLLNMAAANAIAQLGREGVSALAKNRSTMRIDPLVAMVMACWPFGDGQKEEFDVAAMIA